MGAAWGVARMGKGGWKRGPRCAWGAAGAARRQGRARLAAVGVPGGALPGGALLACWLLACRPPARLVEQGPRRRRAEPPPARPPASPKKACNRNNFVCVPLYETLGEDAIEYILAHSESRAVFVHAKRLGRVAKALAAAPAGQVAAVVHWGGGETKADVEVRIWGGRGAEERGPRGEGCRARDAAALPGGCQDAASQSARGGACGPQRQPPNRALAAAAIRRRARAAGRRRVGRQGAVVRGARGRRVARQAGGARAAVARGPLHHHVHQRHDGWAARGRGARAAEARPCVCVRVCVCVCVCVRVCVRTPRAVAVCAQSWAFVCTYVAHTRANTHARAPPPCFPRQPQGRAADAPLAGGGHRGVQRLPPLVRRGDTRGRLLLLLPAPRARVRQARRARVCWGGGDAAIAQLLGPRALGGAGGRGVGMRGVGPRPA
jgi:hypothetical protein